MVTEGLGLEVALLAMQGGYRKKQNRKEQAGVL